MFGKRRRAIIRQSPKLICVKQRRLLTLIEGIKWIVCLMAQSRKTLEIVFEFQLVPAQVPISRRTKA